MRAIELQTANIKLKNDYDSELKKNVIIIPTFADVHVHLREPGFFYKETIRTGTMAAARSGYGLLMSMPNSRLFGKPGARIKNHKKRGMHRCDTLRLHNQRRKRTGTFRYGRDGAFRGRIHR